MSNPDFVAGATPVALIRALRVESFPDEGPGRLSLTPVSYTHLDVYKRQMLTGALYAFYWLLRLSLIHI
ncbi:hypothetical protein [Erwinia amylovora]